MSKGSIEHFWGASARTPVENRLYDAPPFGWHNKVTPTDFQRCITTPYYATDTIKGRLNEQMARAENKDENQTKEGFLAFSNFNGGLDWGTRYWVMLVLLGMFALMFLWKK